jgi:hypothetical protein
MQTHILTDEYISASINLFHFVKGKLIFFIESNHINIGHKFRWTSIENKSNFSIIFMEMFGYITMDVFWVLEGNE